MPDRLVSVESGTHQFPPAVREVVAANLTNPLEVEGAALIAEFVTKKDASSWASWTGTANRTTRATSTATTTQVAEALKALVDDLKAAGVI